MLFIFSDRPIDGPTVLSVLVTSLATEQSEVQCIAKERMHAPNNVKRQQQLHDTYWWASILSVLEVGCLR